MHDILANGKRFISNIRIIKVTLVIHSFWPHIEILKRVWEFKSLPLETSNSGKWNFNAAKDEQWKIDLNYR